MKKKEIIFEYEDIRFEGVLEYQEDYLLSVLGKKVYEITITKPLSYSISFIPKKEANPIRIMWYGGKRAEYYSILNMAIKEAIAYYFKRDKFVSIHDLIERKIDEGYEKSKPLVKPMEEQIEIFKDAFEKLRELRKLKILNLREFRSKVKLIRDKIAQLQGQIRNQQIQFLGEYIEEAEIKQLFKSFDKDKLKIIEIKSIDE